MTRKPPVPWTYRPRLARPVFLVAFLATLRTGRFLAAFGTVRLVLDNALRAVFFAAFFLPASLRLAPDFPLGPEPSIDGLHGLPGSPYDPKLGVYNGVCDRVDELSFRHWMFPWMARRLQRSTKPSWPHDRTSRGLPINRNPSAPGATVGLAVGLSRQGEVKTD